MRTYRMALAVSTLSSLLALFPAAPAAAQTSGLGVMTRGSFLVFPLIDFANPARTIVTVTNTNVSTVVCGGGFRQGDVDVYFAYYDGSTCLVTDRFHSLTPGDTISFRADQFFPDARGRGWMYAEARDPNTNRPIDFDFLIGSVNLGDQHANQKYWYGAYSFQSFAGESGSPFGTTVCGHPFSGSIGDSTASFNGVEYAPFPQNVYLDFFVGEGTPPELGMGSTIASRLVMISPVSTETRLTMQIRDNNEHFFSRLQLFTCQLDARLSDLTVVTRHDTLRSQYDSRELGGLPYGWISFTGDNGILGCFVERVIRADGKPIQSFGRTLHFSGERIDVFIRRFNP